MGKSCCSNNSKQKGFIAKLIEKLDKKLEKKSQQSCCDSTDKNKSDGSSCCN